MNDHDIQTLNARADAIAYISTGKRSSGKVRDKLFRKGYSHDIITDVVSELVDERRIDDEAYAAYFIKTRTGAKAMSAAALRSRLISSGVPAGIASKVVSEAVSSQNDEEKNALGLLRLKFGVKADKMLESDTDKHKSFLASMFRFLISRGFDGETAAEAVRKFMKENDE